MRKPAKDWTGYENENWKVHGKARFCKKERKTMWLTECKHCGKVGERRSFALTRSKSCGCQNPPPANKGTRKMDESDMVAGYWLLRKPWSVGAKMETAA